MARVVKNVPASAGYTRDSGSIPGSGRSSRDGNWQPTPGFLPGESHRRRSLVDYSPRGSKESDTTERLTKKHGNPAPRHSMDEP